MKVMARARRSFGMSMLVLLLGFIAIGGALVYRASRDDGGANTAYALQSVKLPAGAETLSASAADGKVTVTYRSGADVEARVFDAQTGEQIGQFAIETE